MDETMRTVDRQRASPAQAARQLSVTALSRVGELLGDPQTDARILLQAAKLVLWAAGQGADEADSGGLELRFTGGADGDL